MLPPGANFWCDSSREAFTLAGAFSSSALRQTKPSEAQDYADEEYLRTEERQKLATLKERLAEAREYLTYIEQHIDDLERDDKDAERERLKKEKAGSK
ncbi:hypothetical protein LTR66_004901 [Elasticomyces elasticus]|nr:hypothetical protein LTR66_004901 [Elasticomyces elasticus]